MNLMKSLQPFVQSGIITGPNAKTIIDDYVTGSNEQILAFCLRPDIPAPFAGLVKTVREFAQ